MRQGPRVSLEQHFAAGQKQHAIADRFHFVHIVRGPQDAAVIFRGEAPDLRAD